VAKDPGRSIEAVPDESLGMIELLADGEFHSGEELGQFLGVSRAAVWKRLQHLQSLLGIRFESVPGRGYRLPDGVELLNAERIHKALPATAAEWLRRLEVHSRIDSTNRRAALLAQGGAGSGVVIVAEQQSAGSGRRGRRWVSPFGRNIYFSTLWAFDGGVGALEGLSLVVGLVVARVIAPLTERDVRLKWPNDLLVDARKMAGILIEVAGDVDGRCTAIIGIGINVNMVGAEQAEAIDQVWIDVSTVARAPVSRNALIAELIAELVLALTVFEREGFAAFQQEWRTRDYLRGETVAIESGNRVQSGVALGVDASGALLLDIEGSVQSVHGGEVSVRPVR